jgi:hypothetical protein
MRRKAFNHTYKFIGASIESTHHFGLKVFILQMASAILRSHYKQEEFIISRFARVMLIAGGYSYQISSKVNANRQILTVWEKTFRRNMLT